MDRPSRRPLLHAHPRRRSVAMSELDDSRAPPGILRCWTLDASFGDCCEQADVPAEQPAPGEDARLSGEDAYSSGARDHRGATEQGPLRALCLSPVLPARHRMRRRADFTTAVRRGRRSASGRIVIHLAAGDAANPALVGLVVPRAVGGAVDRNRVKRRLRAVLSQQVRVMPAGSLVVVRALPGAAGASFGRLREDLEAALRRATRGASSTGSRSSPAASYGFVHRSESRSST